MNIFHCIRISGFFEPLLISNNIHFNYSCDFLSHEKKGIRT